METYEDTLIALREIEDKVLMLLKVLFLPLTLNQCNKDKIWGCKKKKVLSVDVSESSISPSLKNYLSLNICLF